MHSSVKRVAFLSVVALSTLGLAACGSNAGSPSGTSGSSAAMSAASDQAANQPMQNNEVSMKELLTDPSPHQCTVTYDDQSSHISATIRLSHGMMRGDYTTVSGGQTTVAHTIMKDNLEYTWLDGQSQGYKMPASTDTSSLSDQTGPASGQMQGTGPNLDQKMAYHCGAWSGDASAFTPPATINFMDLTNMRQYMPSGN